MNMLLYCSQNTGSRSSPSWTVLDTRSLDMHRLEKSAVATSLMNGMESVATRVRNSKMLFGSLKGLSVKLWSSPRLVRSHGTQRQVCPVPFPETISPLNITGFFYPYSTIRALFWLLLTIFSFKCHFDISVSLVFDFSSYYNACGGSLVLMSTRFISYYNLGYAFLHLFLLVFYWYQSLGFQFFSSPRFSMSP